MKKFLSFVLVLSLSLIGISQLGGCQTAPAYNAQGIRNDMSVADNTGKMWKMEDLEPDGTKLDAANGVTLVGYTVKENFGDKLLKGGLKVGGGFLGAWGGSAVGKNIGDQGNAIGAATGAVAGSEIAGQATDAASTGKVWIPQTEIDRARQLSGMVTLSNPASISSK